ncbi:hypothetical protein Vadar_026292 [Vaccinium darrowii]|uniref:Uncharacterized protein n=1 Tax=Vaccinium darrowii TaxID=229202 RepID=A0ACB7X3W8_9ERIC|nr:hypothetical protein Vadar_026292 [Vaccinium darrowii]
MTSRKSIQLRDKVASEELKRDSAEEDAEAFGAGLLRISNFSIKSIILGEYTVYWKVKDIDSAEQRAKGYCPLTPKEVGIFLTDLGFPSNTPIYIAAGEIYGAEDNESRQQKIASWCIAGVCIGALLLASAASFSIEEEAVKIGIQDIEEDGSVYEGMWRIWR